MVALRKERPGCACEGKAGLDHCWGKVAELTFTWRAVRHPRGGEQRPQIVKLNDDASANARERQAAISRHQPNRGFRHAQPLGGAGRIKIHKEARSSRRMSLWGNVCYVEIDALRVKRRLLL